MLPAFVLACSPFIPGLLERRGPRNVIYGLACAASALALAAAAYLAVDDGQRTKLLDTYGIEGVGPSLAMGLGSALICTMDRSCGESKVRQLWFAPAAAASAIAAPNCGASAAA